MKEKPKRKFLLHINRKIKKFFIESKNIKGDLVGPKFSIDGYYTSQWEAFANNMNRIDRLRKKNLLNLSKIIEDELYRAVLDNDGFIPFNIFTELWPWGQEPE